MRRSNSQTLGEVLMEYVQALKLGPRLHEMAAGRYWEEVMGQNIARLSSDVRLKNGVLYVRIHSAELRNELFMRRSDIVIRLNRRIGSNAVQAIQFI